MSERPKNRIIVLEPITKSTTELLKLIEEKGSAELVRVDKFELALQELAASLPCMFITNIIENADVPARVQMFKRLENAVKHQGLKIFVVTPIKNRQLADMVTQKLGVAEYIIEPVPVRTMLFKTNLQLKAIDSFRKQQEMKKLGDQVTIKKLDNTKKQDGTPATELKANQKPAMQMAEDTFLFKNSGVKKTGKKITLELDGPDPSTGEWVPHEDKGDAQTSWRWVPNEEKEAQAGKKDGDGWVHEGDKPVFNEATNKWAMTSENPSLALRKKGKKVAQKVGMDEKGEVFVAEDSPEAEENLKKNREKALKVKKEKKKLGDSEGKPEAAAEDEESGLLGIKKAEGEVDAKEKKELAKSASDAGKGLAELKNKLGNAAASDGLAGELNDQREPNQKDSPLPFNDLKKEEEEEEGEGPSLKFKKKKEKPEDGNKSPLDFLAKKKQKKEEQDKLASLRAGLEEEEKKSVSTVQEELTFNDKTKSEGDEVSPLNGLKQRTKKAKGKDSPEDLYAEEEESEERPDAPGYKSRPKIHGKNAEAERAEALREDPADARAELRDLQGKGSKAKSKELNQLKKKLLSEIQDKLNEPLPTEMSAEEEEAIREELGLKGRPEIKPKDLARKKRLKDVKNMKSRLADLDLELNEEEEAGEAVSRQNLAPDEPAPLNKGDLSRDKLNGIGRAIDTDTGFTDEELEELKERRKKERTEREKNAVLDAFHYVPEEEILPRGNAWESAHPFYVYLPSTVRYKGFNKIEDLLPLWTAEAEDVPQLLDKTREWRFRGGKPVQAKTLAEVPKEVRDFLVGLRDQLLKGEGKDKDEEKSSALDSLARELEEEKQSGKKDRVEEDFSRGEKEAEAEEAEDFSRKKRENTEAESRAEDSPSEDGDSKKESEDPMERLRAKFAADDAEALKQAREDKANSASEENGSYADKLGKSEELKSKGVQDFLERRKRKKEEAASAEEFVKNGAETPAVSASGRRAMYLGVLIALADAASPEISQQKAMERVLNALEIAFENCFAACVSVQGEGQQAVVVFGSASAPKIGELVSLGAGLSVPITRTSGGKEEILGYLFLQKKEAGEPFKASEEKTVREAALRLWPILAKPSASAGAA